MRPVESLPVEPSTPLRLDPERGRGVESLWVERWVERSNAAAQASEELKHTGVK
jgi:hypothetical protein